MEAIVIEKLSKALRPLSDEQGANTAVSLILKLENADFSALFVKRVENLADPWSGQIALPGGKRDVHDLSLKQTIMRETLEETNIDLSHDCRFLGVSTALRSRPRPGLLILPFVILFEHKPSIRLNESELEGFIWIPLNKIIRGKGSVEFDFGEAPAYIVGRTIIWGLTFRVLEDFINIFERVRQEHHSYLTQ